MDRCERLWGRILTASRVAAIPVLSDYHRKANESRFRQLVDSYYDAIEDEIQRREQTGYLWRENVTTALPRRTV